MPSVDFYIIDETQPPAHSNFMCRLIEKAYQRGHKIFINCNDQQQMHLVDELLWTFKDISFIPHHIIGEGPLPPPPIQLGNNQQPSGFNDILLNLAAQIPHFHAHFKRIIEIVSQDQSIKQVSREHFKFYREQNYTLNTHDLT